MTLTRDEVLAESAAWVWVPEDALELRTPGWRLIGYPEHFAEPTMVTSLDSEQDPGSLVDDVLAAVGEWGRDSVAFFGVSAATRPAGLEAVLGERGELCETFDVLAQPLAELPSLDVPAGVELRRVVDVETRRDMDVVDTAVFGGSALSDEQVAASVARKESDGDEDSWVAYLDGRPVGTGGLAVAGDVARLWGGAVLEEARGAGVYRALLDERLRVGRDRGCRMALVKARVETSGPILRRAGFTAYGEQRAYRLTRG